MMDQQEYVEGDMMDGEYDQEDMMGDEMQDGEMMDDEDMMGYGDEEDDNSFGFDNDPQYADFPGLDPRRKVRREILKTINEMRDKYDRPNVHMDILTNHAAENYAEFLLREEESA